MNMKHFFYFEYIHSLHTQNRMPKHSHAMDQAMVYIILLGVIMEPVTP